MSKLSMHDTVPSCRFVNKLIRLTLSQKLLLGSFVLSILMPAVTSQQASATEDFNLRKNDDDIERV